MSGRERIYLDRFWNEFSATPSRFSEAAREHYAKLYALPGAMHSGFAQFAAFDQDAIDNKAFLAAKGKLGMPVLAIGGHAVHIAYPLLWEHEHVDHDEDVDELDSIRELPARLR